LRSFPKFSRRPLIVLCTAGFTIFAAGWLVTASGALPEWIRNIEARTEIEAAFFRMMSLPGGEVAFRRPSSETRPALGDLLKKQPGNAGLYSLRALEDEQQLDFTAAEADWKNFAEKSDDKVGGQLSLADFYHRRLRPLDEIKTLSAAASAPADISEKLTPGSEQRSWRAFERIFGVIRAQGLPAEVSVAQYRSWIARYPQEPSLYPRFLEYLIGIKDFSAATQLIAQYHEKFPADEILPVKARALVEYRQGSVQQGLAVYEKGFQPLWAPELIKSYFDLLTQTHSLRKFLDEARAAQQANPEDLSAAARIFYYYQQQGKLDAAQETLTKFRLRKETSGSAWSAQELYVCARLLEEIHAYPESARFYFALYNSKGMNDAQERGLGGLANVLLTAPEMPIRFGAGELSMYRDIATMDQGPGYLNGILSLLLNTASPASEFSGEEDRAVSYFHRSRAAELIALFDTKFPSSSRRAELHAALLEYYSSAGESEAVIKGGKEFLSDFPKAPQRTAVALLMADAYSRTGKTREEFAIYDAVLQELAAKADRIPLGARDSEAESYSPMGNSVEEGEESDAERARQYEARLRESSVPSNAAFQVKAASAAAQGGARSPEYARVLERYLARLVELKEIPQALGVLRRELDHNPDDPGLYERLAVFLEQNRLGVEQEEIYRRAMAHFPDHSWYHKLARLYLRERKNSEFEKLTQDAVGIFKGSELEHYFQSLVGGTAEMYLRLNLYANRRFPHNPVFVRNLLSAYMRTETYNEAAWEAVLRQHWFEEQELRNRFFEYLTRKGRLDSEMKALQQSASPQGNGHWGEFVGQNPAAGQYLAQAYVWRSHFEESAPVLQALAEEYPADGELGQTASSVFRSLAYFDPAATGAAVKIEEHLLAANPGNSQNLARIGDIYADRELFAKAAPYWERIPRVAPGEAGGYLEAATIYWDYFDFDNALRLLAEGRGKLADDALYSYEAGAIYEGKRDYARAVQEYVKGALAAGEQSPAESRLLALATRAKFRDLVERETQKPAAGPGAPMAAVLLRVRVLEIQNRKTELASFLDSVVSGASTIEQAAEIENLAQQKSLEAVRQHALEKQAALASDPITRMQLRYTLARLYESRKEFSAAQRNVESLYKENPKILGVVRSTADFYWRMKLYPEAIAVLQQAAKDAYPELGKQFAFEAARKSTEARLFPQAREALAQLLKDSPYDSQYLGAVADTYAQAGDQQGLKQFYLEKIALFRNAPLSADDRKARVAALRRGLIPALARLLDYAGAVDQYVEIINVFPEDENVVTEAALFAARYKRQQQLVDYYAKTVQQSPRDYRWSMVLARIQASLEDFPGAIETYAKAIAIRPDRADLRIARAGLTERMMRFDEAIGEYERVYQLAYKDPKWMEKIAEIRARQGRADDAVAALKTALIDGRPEKAENFFEAARRLESWGLLTQARGFAEQGVASAGGELLASTENHAGAKLYTRILTRLRQQETAYATLQNVFSAASSALPVIKEQIAKEGVSAARDSEWRQRQKEIRMENAREGLQAALVEMGSAAARYFTPEEKVALGQFAQKLRGSQIAPDAVERYAIPLAESAGLAEKEAAWRYELLMSENKPPQQLVADMNAYIGLQRRRLVLEDLGPQLERFAVRLTGGYRPAALIAAAQAYRAVSDEENELRVLATVGPGNLGGENQKRLFSLLLSHRPEQLVQIAASWTPWGQQAADFVVAYGDAALAHAVVAARGRVRPPVWSKAYGALAGLYFAEPSPEINNTFLSALGDSTIAERLGKKVDRDAQLAGDIWFYYGSRYGEYLGVTKQGTPDDFLPALLEQSPATASGYLALADYYAETGDTHAAISDYNHTLELAPGRADVLDRLAVAYYKQGSRSEALAHWKLALSTLKRQIDSARAPESFWTDFARICDHLQTRHLFTPLKADADALLRAYLRRNGNYRSNAPLRSAFLAVGDAAAATSWILDLASAAPEPTLVLADIADAPWIPLTQRAPIYQRILENKQNALSHAEGLQKDSALEDLRSWQVSWAKYLIETKQFSQAADYIAALPIETQHARAASLVPFELQAAAQLGTLDTKIAGYRADSSSAPSPEGLRAAARQIFDAGDKQSARKLIEFVFAREIDSHHLVASNFLGLAEIRVAAGDTAGALELLRRLVVVVGNPYENLDPVAALLEKTGHAAEAVEFLDQLVKSAPWEDSYRLRLAKARITAKDAKTSADALATIASSPAAAYAVRVEAAIARSGAQTAVDLGSAELKLLCGGPRSISTAAADQAFFYDARLKASENATDARAKLQPLRKALADIPARGDARIPLFKAAESVHSDEIALLAIDSLLHEQLLRRGPADENNEEEIVSSGDTDSDASDEEAPAQTYAATKLLPAEQAQISLAVANALVRLRRWSEALPYLQIAKRLEKTPARRKEITSKLAEARTVLRRERLNLARQPILHQDLEQDRVVRPRLVVRAATPAKASATGGE
jgi:cellulose synthase operon protein C